MEQTAVEYLADKVSEIIGWIPQTVEQEEALLEALEKAKEMEKEQIIDAHIHAQFNVILAKKEIAEQYYTKTFKTK
jgi:thiamine pyrophosphate-dependent acetolactate synthase large subunit-like protein